MFPTGKDWTNGGWATAQSDWEEEMLPDNREAADDRAQRIANGFDNLNSDERKYVVEGYMNRWTELAKEEEA